LAAFNDLFQNAFQSLYHLSRLELGVIVENQIYTSPEMYNRSISPVYVPDIEGAANTLPSHIPASAYSNANISRASTSNATLMSEWISSVRSFNDSDRVPVMLYLRSVPQLKPMGSAITSVFVSTFAMVSALWSIFNVVAGAYARSHLSTPIPSTFFLGWLTISTQTVGEMWTSQSQTRRALMKVSKGA
jgi:hypothetical protein